MTLLNSFQSVFRPNLFAGQTVLVTGGGSGIGRCTAHELASLGAHVVLVGRNPDKLSATAQEIIGDGGQASWHSTDIRREGDVQAMVAQVVQQHGRIHGLVNNAGGQYISPLSKTSAKGWQAVIDTNLTGAFRTVKRASKGMLKARFGRIILISSVVGLYGSAGQVNYSASKSALVGMARALGDRCPQIGRCRIRFELAGQLGVFMTWELPVPHDPFAFTGNGVQPEVNEHPNLGVAPPRNASFSLISGADDCVDGGRRW